MRARQSILIVGSGAFGVTSALELARRGQRVTLMDPGPIPHPKAASTDISKVIRMDYGSDQLYTSMMEDALLTWDQWNHEWDEPPYHEDGFLLLTQNKMQPGSLEHDSFKALQRRGYRPQRLNAEILRRSIQRGMRRSTRTDISIREEDGLRADALCNTWRKTQLPLELMYARISRSFGSAMSRAGSQV